MKSILKIDHLIKSYGPIQAVNDISLEVNEGELFAFLGPNGAGKSTTINVLCTLLSADSGEVMINGFVLGKDDDKIRKDIGVVFQKSFLDNLLTVYENLATRASFYGLSKTVTKARIDDLTEQLSLGEFIHRPYGKLSGGQRRRAEIARALVNHPRLLFLDEPTTGLDPQTRHSIWNYIDELRRKHKMTIFLTTHYMEEAARCDRVCIIDHGVILELDTPTELRLKYAPTLLRLKTSKDLTRTLDQESFTYTKTAQGYEVVIPQSKASLAFLNTHQAEYDHFEVLEGTMDTVFLALTGKVIREDNL
jgi:multidrug/hemolysin transport system ATP-binding protein